MPRTASLLALFGDNFALQFLSQSITWLDHIIFAMAPLGILTAVTGAIRVSGSPGLRALIGQARESRASAEAELMSSTSHEVSELWDGNSIARAAEKHVVTQIVVLEHCEKKDSSKVFTLMNGKTIGVFTLKTAMADRYLTREGETFV
jgi:hypothetical protein